MNFKPLKINDQYHHAYASFSKFEINKLIRDSLIRNGYEANFLQLSRDDQNIIIDDVRSKIIEEIESSIYSLDIVIISEILYLFRGKISFDTPLFVVAKMCIVPEDLNLIFPDTIINLKTASTSPNVLKVILNRLLINNNFFNLVEEKEISSIEDYIVLDAIIDGIQQELTLDWLDEDSLVDFDLIIGYNIGSEISPDYINLDNISYAKIKNIYKKIPLELTDEIVRKLNIFNVKTKEEFLKKVTIVIQERQNRDFAVSKILEYLTSKSNIKIEPIVIEHFIQLIANEFECSIEEVRDEWNNLEEDHFGNLINQITKQYIVHYAFKNNSNFVSDEYYKIIKEEYNLHRALMLVENSIQEYELFLREQLDIIILFNFFYEEGLILK